MIIAQLPQRGLARLNPRVGVTVSASILVVAVWALSSLHLAPALAAATDAGPALVVTPNDGTASGNTPLTTGTSDTNFSLRLPTGAECRGDSANDGYRVQSFMVPESVDPATLTFDADGPVPSGLGADFRQPLYDVFFSPFVQASTAPATTPPGPGPVVNIPSFNFAVFVPPENILPGIYNLGVACTLGVASSTQLDRFWNVQMTFAAATVSEENPGGITWAVSQAQTTTTTTSATSTTSTTRGATTSTTRGATTTTAGGATTTTAAGAASTTTTATGGATGGVTTTTSAGGALARTGGGSIPLIFWAVPLVVLGRMAVLVARRPRVRTGPPK